MEKRHSSPSSRAFSPRPKTHRKRSNSFPIVEALGCSASEAELILAESRAAIRSRHSSRRGRGRQNRPESEDARTFRPQDHLKYLVGDDEVVGEVKESLSVEGSSRHTRIPSNITDRSTSTVTGPTAPSAETSQSPKSPSSPLGDYSANLAKFIQSQLNAIPSYHPMVYPRSCPDLALQARTPPQSPTRLDRRPSDIQHVLEMPPVRPPLRSAFSAWSSTDDEIDDDVPPLPSLEQPGTDSKASVYDPAILRYYENSNEASFLFSSTPLEEGGQHPNVDKFTFPKQSATVAEAHSPNSPNSLNRDDHDDASSTLSTHPQLTSSSAPSFSSTSTASYFDYKRPITLAPHVRNRIIAAVSPRPNGKILTAISPFEGGAISNVHDIFIESQNRVHVDGLSFDLIRDFNIPDDTMRTAPRVPTPC